MIETPRVAVREVSPAEMAHLLRGGIKKEAPALVGMGFKIEGFVDAVCRENKSGEVAWEVHQPNLMTDLGRRYWLRQAFNNGDILTSPSLETPSVGRYSVPDSGFNHDSQSSGNITPTNNPSTLTKTFATSFGSPSQPRTVGTIGLGVYSTLFGASTLLCYSLISPARVQSTSQTLEISYRLTMTPVA